MYRTHLDVIDDQTVNVQTLVVGVRLGVAQQLQQELGRLLGPASLGGAPLLGLRASADTTVEATERYALLVVGHVLQETLSATQRHVLDGLGCLVCVLYCIEPSDDTSCKHYDRTKTTTTRRGTYLEMHTQMRAARLARLGGVVWFVRVATHYFSAKQKAHNQLKLPVH